MASSTASLNKDAKFPCFVCGRSVRRGSVWVSFEEKCVEVCVRCQEKYNLEAVPV